jgi:hypothetical protein
MVKIKEIIKGITIALIICTIIYIGLKYTLPLIKKAIIEFIREIK